VVIPQTPITADRTSPARSRAAHTPDIRKHARSPQHTERKEGQRTMQKEGPVRNAGVGTPMLSRVLPACSVRPIDGTKE
jgi:hypothetical protein